MEPVPESQDWIIWTFLGVLAYLAIFGGLGAWVAGEKYRRGVEGMWLGILFGPFGVIVEGLLPVIVRQPAAQAKPAPAQASKPLPPPTPKPKPMQAEEWVPEFPDERMPRKGKG